MAAGDVNIAYSSKVDLTCTLTSLADGSWRESAVVNQNTPLDLGGWLAGSVQTGTSPTSGNTIDFYLYGSIDGSTDYTGGASGSDAAYTANGEEDEFIWIGSVTVDATSDQDYEFGPWSVEAAFGGAIPNRWGVVVENNSGATLNATGTNNDLDFMGWYQTVEQ